MFECKNKAISITAAAAAAAAMATAEMSRVPLKIEMLLALYLASIEPD